MVVQLSKVCACVSVCLCVGRYYSCLRVLLCTGKKRFPHYLPPHSICIKISVKIKVCFLYLADCNSNSFQERISNSFLYTAYIHTRLSSTQNNQASWKKKTYFLFLFKPKQTCTVTFKSLLKIAPHFCKEFATGMNLVLSLSNSVSSY